MARALFLGVWWAEQLLFGDEGRGLVAGSTTE